jgi:hypothetical protein
MRHLVWAVLLNVVAGYLRVQHHQQSVLKVTRLGKQAHHTHHTHREVEHHLLRKAEAHTHTVKKFDAELARLNGVIGEYVNAIDAKSRECAQLRAVAVSDQLGRNEAVPVHATTVLMRARRDLTAEQTSLEQLAERAYGERPALDEHREQCRKDAEAGEKQLAALERELGKMAALPEGSTGEVRDRMATALGAIQDRKADVEDAISATAAACKDMKDEMEDQMLHVRLAQERLDVALAHSTAGLNSAADRSAEAADNQHSALDREVEAHQCMKELSDLTCKISGARSARASTQKQAGDTRTVMDCEVSEWIPGPCSVSCGGGQRSLSRHVIADADGGAACPPLGREERCNEQSCNPVDCEMEDWSAWSECEHVQSRVRSVRVHPAAGGMQCGVSAETRICVDDDEPRCELGEWAEWSGCSRACGGGVSIRTRGASDACPKGVQTEVQRLCNKHACGEAPKCAAAAADRLVFVLDGSGSLGSAGFDALKELAAEVAKRVPQAGVILAGAEVQTASELVAGTEAAGKVAALTWPESVTTIPAALGRATAMGAHTVVVLTDGEPNSKRALAAAAAAVREKARLVFVTEAKHDVAEYASSPTHDNVMVLSPFEYKASAADLLVTMLCAQLE